MTLIKLHKLMCHFYQWSYHRCFRDLLSKMVDDISYKKHLRYNIASMMLCLLWYYGWV